MPTAQGERITIAAALDKFKAKQLALDKAPATVYAYTKAAAAFLEACRCTYLDEIGEAEILDHINWLRESLSRRGIGEQNATIQGRLRCLRVFLTSSGVKFPLPEKHWPKVSKRNPDRYSTEDVNKLLGAADEDDKDLILFLLYTGFRDEEVAYCKFSDVDWKKGSVNVHDKPEYAWKVKDREQRPQDIPLDPEFLKRLKARREAQAPCELIFPSGVCRPDKHLIRRVQAVAKRAGIKERVTLHKFRRTFGTLIAKQFGTWTAKELLGHSDIKTTERYLAADKLDSKEHRETLREVFAGIKR